VNFKVRICPSDPNNVQDTIQNKLATHKEKGKRRSSVVVRSVKTFTMLGKEEEDRHREPIRSCCFVQDYAVTAAWDGSAKFWDPVTGQLEHELRLGDDAIGVMVVHPHGDKILTTNSLGQLIIWDVTKLPLHVQVLNIEAHDGLIYCASFNANGTKLVTGSIDKTVKVWDLTNMMDNKIDVEELTASGEGSTAHKDAVLDCKFSPDGKKIVTTSRDKKVIIWDTITLNKITSLDEHQGWVQCALWYNNNTLITAGNDKVLKVWSIPASGEIPSMPVKELVTGHEDSVSAIRLLPDNKIIVSSGYDQKIVFWDPSNTENDEIGEDFPLKSLAPIEAHMDIVSDVNVSPDGTKLITCSVDTRAKVWSMKAIMNQPSKSDSTEV